jgi:AcrR family transcriptional regulator
LLGKLDTARNPGEKSDRRINRTRLALLEAAQRLFALRSVEGVSIDDIAKEAEVAKGSLYNHFDSKEALADELFRMMRSHVADLLDAAVDSVTPPPERLVRGSFVILRFALDHPESAAALLKLSPELLDDAAPLNVQAREVVIDGLESGHFKGIPADSATLLVVGASLVMLQDSIDRQKSVKRLVAKMIPLMAGVLRALGVDATSAASAAKAAARATLE